MHVVVVDGFELERTELGCFELESCRLADFGIDDDDAGCCEELKRTELEGPSSLSLRKEELCLFEEEEECICKLDSTELERGTEELSFTKEELRTSEEDRIFELDSSGGSELEAVFTEDDRALSGQSSGLTGGQSAPSRTYTIPLGAPATLPPGLGHCLNSGQCPHRAVVPSIHSSLHVSIVQFVELSAGTLSIPPCESYQRQL